MPETEFQPQIEKKKSPYKPLFQTPEVATSEEAARRSAQVSEMLTGGPFPEALQKALEEPPFKVEPPVADKSGHVKKALGRLQGQNVIGFAPSAPTLNDFFHNAETATEGHSPTQGRAQLVALKLAGKQLLERLYAPAKVGDIIGQDEQWEKMTEEERAAEAAASMMILKAEMEWLKMRQQDGPQEQTVLPTLATRSQGERSPISARDASRLAREFRRFARREDIPQGFRDDLEAAARVYLDPIIEADKQRRAEVSKGKSENVLDEIPVSQEERETVARKRSDEVTVVNLSELPSMVSGDMSETTRRAMDQALSEGRERRRYGDLSKEEKKRLKFVVGLLRKLELYTDGIPVGEAWDEVQPHLPEVVELSVLKGSLPDKYWVNAKMWIKNALQELGILDDDSVLLTHELAQQLQYALHSNRHSGRSDSWGSWFQYWLSWGGINWFNSLGTRLAVLGKGWKSFLRPRDIVGKQAIGRLREARDKVTQAARQVARSLDNSSQPLGPTEQVIKALLELMVDEFEAVSEFERRKL